MAAEYNQEQQQRRQKTVFLTTVALCSSSLIHAFLLISVFPYAGYFVMDLIPSLTPEMAGPYAGLLSSSFMAGRTCSSYPWGVAADVYGRKFVLVASLVLSAVLSTFFGMSQSFIMAMTWRFLLGLSNGIVGTVKTVVSEFAAQQQSPQETKHANNKDNSLETRMMGLVVGMRAWGFLVSPAIGGWLAEPVQQYRAFFRDSSALPQWVGSWLEDYPFALPNLVGAILCFVTALVVAGGIQETLPPEKQHKEIWYLPSDCAKAVLSKFKNGSCQARQLGQAPVLCSSEKVPLNATANSVVMYDGSNCDNDNIFAKHVKVEERNESLWSNYSIRKHLIPYWGYSLVVVCLDEAFPLFCIARNGGLGLSEDGIGKVLSMAGLVFAICQYCVYVHTVNRCGLYPSLWIGCCLGFLPILFIPLSLLLQANVSREKEQPNRTLGDGGQEHQVLNWKTLTLLVVAMALSKIYSCMFFTSMSIALNKIVATDQRARLNGFAGLGGSIAKGIGPIFAGILTAVSFTSIPSATGSLVVFGSIAALAFSILLLLPKDP